MKSEPCHFNPLYFILSVLVLSVLLCSIIVCCSFAHDADSGVLGDYSQFVSFSNDDDTESVEIPVNENTERVLEESAEILKPEQFDDNSEVIRTKEDLLAFAVKCKDPAWSFGKTVSLENDIDLKNIPFEPIYMFSGAFYGNKHIISGLNVSGSYSRAGLFGVLTEYAYVSELKVEGSVYSVGDAFSGGIAGENSGTIQNCIFQGYVSSDYAAGGITGVNFEKAYVMDSKSGGEVIAPACVGGIAADNKGSIISCENHAGVSTGKAGIEALFDHSALKGAICGTSSGTEESCVDASVVSSSAIKLDRRILLLVIFVVLGISFLSGAIALIVITVKGKD